MCWHPNMSSLIQQLLHLIFDQVFSYFFAYFEKSEFFYPNQYRIRILQIRNIITKWNPYLKMPMGKKLHFKIGQLVCGMAHKTDS